MFSRGRSQLIFYLPLNTYNWCDKAISRKVTPTIICGRPPWWNPFINFKLQLFRLLCHGVADTWYWRRSCGSWRASPQGSVSRHFSTRCSDEDSYWLMNYPESLILVNISTSLGPILKSFSFLSRVSKSAFSISWHRSSSFEGYLVQYFGPVERRIQNMSRKHSRCWF